MGISQKKKELLVKFQNYKCEQCKKKFKMEELEIHKLNNKLGYSNHRNLKVVCQRCHDFYSSAHRIAMGIQ